MLVFLIIQLESAVFEIPQSNNLETTQRVELDYFAIQKSPVKDSNVYSGIKDKRYSINTYEFGQILIGATAGFGIGFSLLYFSSLKFLDVIIPYSGNSFEEIGRYIQIYRYSIITSWSVGGTLGSTFGSYLTNRILKKEKELWKALLGASIGSTIGIASWILLEPSHYKLGETTWNIIILSNLLLSPVLSSIFLSFL